MLADRRKALVHLALLALVVALVPQRLTAAEPAPALPDLAPVAPHQVIGPSTEFLMTLGVDAPLIVDGCFADERVRKGAERCLRFDGIVANVGEGAFEVTYRVDASETLASAFQRIYDSMGGHDDRFSTGSEFHPTHAHFHIQDFYVARLWRASEDGRIRGRSPVSKGDKNGFCPEDSEPVDEKRPAERPTRYACFEETDRFEPGGQVVGISAGWMDIYSANLPDQFVEISGVPDGYYVLEIEIDPHDVFEESNENNNIVCSLIRLSSTVAELVKGASRCPRGS
jgi:hypothetical protein